MDFLVVFFKFIFEGWILGRVFKVFLEEVS